MGIFTHVRQVVNLNLEARLDLEVLTTIDMGQESVIIGVIIIVLTVIGGAAAFFVWHRLHRSRRRGESIEMRHALARGPDGRRVRERRSGGRRVRDRDRGQESRRERVRDQGGLSIADIVGDTNGNFMGGTRSDEQRDGRSLADILNPPPRSARKSSAAKKGKKKDTPGELKERPGTADAESSSAGRVPQPTTEQPAAGVGEKSKWKKAPGRIQRPDINPANSDTQLIRLESSPNRSQDGSSVNSEPSLSQTELERGV
ncbi:hypothetical protein NHQ30_009237 [Ciborinia camelliae]|nr:hypothetical protein NHQ30_009237 [Ciborinia camelliae]